MQLDISPENAQFLQEQVAVGVYATPAQAANAAIEVLKKHSELRVRIQRGLRQLDQGEYRDFDEGEMDEFFQELFVIAEAGGSPG